jgi:hypothetical protein
MGEVSSAEPKVPAYQSLGKNPIVSICFPFVLNPNPKFKLRNM